MAKTVLMRGKMPITRYWNDGAVIVEYKEAGKKKPLGQCVKVEGGWFAYHFTKDGFESRFEAELQKAKEYVETKCQELVPTRS